jgi:hypothetical protein
LLTLQGKKDVMKTIAMAVCLIGCVAGAAFAQGSGMAKGQAMTVEQRQKMATAHEKMAACLRSDKAVEECRGELMKSCQEDGGACPMMGGNGGPMKHGRRMQPPTK